MECSILTNGMKLIYEHSAGDITSFTIGFEAGALMETPARLGIAHVTEHMVFKGTKSLSEKEINIKCDEIFGFNNAMTNYPYVVYYGTCLNEDLKDGAALLGDVVMNPSFPEEGFKEEMNVIKEELKDWQDDLAQHCEDMLFYNAFNDRRIKELIIGDEAHIDKFTLQDIKGFYNEFYRPEEAVISVVSSLSFEDVVKIFKDIFETWKPEAVDKQPTTFKLYENPKPGTFSEVRQGVNGGKIQYIFPIHELDAKEITALRIFNEVFGEGTSCILYDEIRTNRGLAYDVGAKLKNEKGIKLYSITMGVSSENIKTATDTIEKLINQLASKKYVEDIFTAKVIKRAIKSQKLKRMLGIEKSIVLSMNMAVYEIMYKNPELVFNEFSNIDYINADYIYNVLQKVFISGTNKEHMSKMILTAQDISKSF